MKLPIYLILITTLLSSCEKFFEFEQEVDFGQKNTEEKYVIQSVIQTGYPAYAFVTKSEPYFSAVSPNNLENMFITDAKITITDSEGQSVELVNINEIPSFGTLDSIAQIFPGFYIEWPISNLISIDESEINFNNGPYNTIARNGKEFQLSAVINQDTLFGRTIIPHEHLIDSLWFEIDEFAPRENLGNFWFHYSDPDTMGNTIMIEHKRLAHTKEVFWGDNPPEGTEPNTYYVKQVQDPLFAKALWGSVRNDFEGLNGTSFDTYFQRGTISPLINSSFDEVIFEQEENGYFKSGQSIKGHKINVYPDTVLVRLSQIDYNSYLFWRSVDFQASSNGNPFAEPINIQSNIENGYGVFYGQAAVYYKLIAKEDTTYFERYFPGITEIL
ncbi:MAG: hypothetical protein CMD38_06715 [Flavobacteriales bacterium]|nr:hypothetical protein [Flavobacteriales bacterium]|tara:strand:- start:2235 stop:3392 length:1158 start_codon:yes stop_codon:yes gene_type:complete